MDFFPSQLAKLQKHLAFVQVDPINWKGYVQGFSRSVTLFETYLLRQYPLYNKTELPAVLAPHFKDDEFQKSQAYGKDKVKFSIFSGLFGQLLGSAMIHYGFYAWAWGTAGHFLARYGYGPQYEVSFVITKRCLSATGLRYTNIDDPINRFRSNTLLRVLHPHPPFILLRNPRPRRKAWIQQNHTITVPSGYLQKLGPRINSRCTIFGCFPIRVQVGG